MFMQGAGGLSINLEKPLDERKFTEIGRYSFSFDDMAFYGDGQGQFLPSHIKYLRLMNRCPDVSAVKSIARYIDISGPLAGLLRSIQEYSQP